MSSVRSVLITFSLASLLAVACGLQAQPYRPGRAQIVEEGAISLGRHPAINYTSRPVNDPVSALARKVAAGEVRLRFNRDSGYLLSILDELRIARESQSLVFSKTSLQSQWITPRNPRAIFYSDDAAVAFIRNAPLLELSAVDSAQGVVFYSVSQQEAERPEIQRNDTCLSCHEKRHGLGVPGMLTLSVGARIGGETVPEFANFATDHRTPFEDRWAGWFITGITGDAIHLGNTMLATDGVSGRPLSPSRPWTTLAGWYSMRNDLSPYSDVAAVMVLEHQAGMTNLMTRFGWETRIALDRISVNPASKAEAERLIETNARALVDYMLFVEEPALPGTFQSTSGFEKKFTALGPFDSQGRSLRQLDLNKRLLRYPCSYMIYSSAFNGLPGPARDAVYARLWTILSGDTDPKYSRLSSSDRAAILGILKETKPDLPSYFRN